MCVLADWRRIRNVLRVADEDRDSTKFVLALHGRHAHGGRLARVRRARGVSRETDEGGLAGRSIFQWSRIGSRGIRCRAVMSCASGMTRKDDHDDAIGDGRPGLAGRRVRRVWAQIEEGDRRHERLASCETAPAGKRVGFRVGVDGE